MKAKKITKQNIGQKKENSGVITQFHQGIAIVQETVMHLKKLMSHVCHYVEGEKTHTHGLQRRDENQTKNRNQPDFEFFS